MAKVTLLFYRALITLTLRYSISWWHGSTAAATRRAIVRAAAEIGAEAKKGTPQPQTQHNKTPQNVLITTDQKFIQTQQKQSKNKL